MKKLMLFCGILFFPMIGSAAHEQSDTLRTSNLDSIIVQAHRAGANTPVTYSEVSGYQMRKENASHSLPMMLALQPSVVATTEGGLGLGYSNFSVRGTDDTRTNVTLNGISLNDSESQKVFWVNMPSDIFPISSIFFSVLWMIFGSYSSRIYQLPLAHL